MGGLENLSRTPRDSQRTRRAFARLTSRFLESFEGLLGDGLDVVSDELVVLAQGVLFVDSSGVGLNIGNGLENDGSDNLRVDAYNGITVNANGVSVDPKADSGLGVDADGVYGIAYHGITIDANGIGAKVKAGEGVLVDADGLYVDNTVYIPYVGATTNVDLALNSLDCGPFKSTVRAAGAKPEVSVEITEVSILGFYNPAIVASGQLGAILNVSDTQFWLRESSPEFHFEDTDTGFTAGLTYSAPSAADYISTNLAAFSLGGGAMYTGGYYIYGADDPTASFTFSGIKVSSGIEIDVNLEAAFQDIFTIELDGIFAHTGKGSSKVGWHSNTPVVQPSVPNTVAMGNTNGEIGGITINQCDAGSDTVDITTVPKKADVETLRDKCEELADDVRNIWSTLDAIKTALGDSTGTGYVTIT